MIVNDLFPNRRRGDGTDTVRCMNEYIHDDETIERKNDLHVNYY